MRADIVWRARLMCATFAGLPIRRGESEGWLRVARGTWRVQHITVTARLASLHEPLRRSSGRGDSLIRPRMGCYQLKVRQSPSRVQAASG